MGEDAWRVGDKVVISNRRHMLHGERAEVTRTFRSVRVVEIALPDGRCSNVLEEHLSSAALLGKKGE